MYVHTYIHIRSVLVVVVVKIIAISPLFVSCHGRFHHPQSVGVAVMSQGKEREKKKKKKKQKQEGCVVVIQK